MHPLEKEVLNTCVESCLFEPGEKVIVGVSGGSDSMGLVCLLNSLSYELKIELIIAHLNHGLRPEEAENEEKLVADIAQYFGLALESGRVDVKKVASLYHLSIEDAARQLRYQFFDDLLLKHSALKIAVGHTSDDQAEEVLIRLIRGTGLKGLSGMDMIRKQKVVRPLLNISKEQVVSYLAQKKIAFLKDSSNDDRRFLRNKIRLDLLPYLSRGFNPNIKQTLLQTASILKDEDDFLSSIVDNLYSDIVLYNDSDFQQLEILVGPFNQLPLAVKRRVVEKALWQMDVKAGFKHIESLVKLALSRPLNQVHMASGLRVKLYDEKMVLSYPQGKVSKRGDLEDSQENSFCLIVDGPGEYFIKETQQKICFDVFEEVPNNLSLTDEEGEYLDFDKLKFPLQVRSRRPGDRFHPLGAPGGKKIGRFLRDIQVPMLDRERVPLLVSGGEVAALLGLRISHFFRVTEATSKVLQIKVEKCLQC